MVVIEATDAEERLRAVLTLIHEIAKLDKARRVSGDLSPTDAVRISREEAERLRAKLNFLLANNAPPVSRQIWPARSRT
jgi:hypothetical protein